LGTLEGLAGLLLSGGDDVAPELYGQEPHPKLEVVDRARDEFELALARAAVARGMPVLGICRGAQVMGVALGGELIQDIPSQVGGAQTHRSASKQAPARHEVRIAEGSLLSRIVGARSMVVNSYHHQGAARFGNGLRPVAWSSDGVVEAVELVGHAFVLGVQWHPERMWRRAPRQRRIFSTFVAAAARYGASGSS
jgi:putative glutamine amidotransferase